MGLQGRVVQCHARFVRVENFLILLFRDIIRSIFPQDFGFDVAVRIALPAEAHIAWPQAVEAALRGAAKTFQPEGAVARVAEVDIGLPTG